MDKYEFMQIVQDIFEQCKTEEEIVFRMKEMQQCITQQSMMSMQYLKVGILN